MLDYVYLMKHMNEITGNVNPVISEYWRFEYPYQRTKRRVKSYSLDKIADIQFGERKVKYEKIDFSKLLCKKGEF